MDVELTDVRVTDSGGVEGAMKTKHYYQKQTLKLTIFICSDTDRFREWSLSISDCCHKTMISIIRTETGNNNMCLITSLLHRNTSYCISYINVICCNDTIVINRRVPC